MADLSYSDEALSVLSAFYGAKKMLYVEGEDDVLFWELVLEKFNKTDLKVQPVNGAKELDKYIIKILNNTIDAIVARDLDFSELQPTSNIDPRILSTFGHSIENTIISPAALCKVIRSHGRLEGSKVNEDECREWLTSFTNAFSDLVLFDAANELENAGVPILSSNCSRFMKTQTSPIPDLEKIKNYLIPLQNNHKLQEAAAQARNKVLERQKEISDFLRGHFLISAALKYANATIKKLGSSKHPSADGFFSSAILAFESVFNNKHPHYDHYRNQIIRL